MSNILASEERADVAMEEEREEEQQAPAQSKL